MFKWKIAFNLRMNSKKALPFMLLPLGEMECGIMAYKSRAGFLCKGIWMISLFVVGKRYLPGFMDTFDIGGNIFQIETNKKLCNFCQTRTVPTIVFRSLIVCVRNTLYIKNGLRLTLILLLQINFLTQLKLIKQFLAAATSRNNNEWIDWKRNSFIDCYYYNIWLNKHLLFLWNLENEQ